MKDRALAQSLGLIAQLGFSIACPMVAFIAGGAWVDGQLGTVPWFLFVGIVLGILAAAGALYQVAKVPLSGRAKRSNKENGSSQAANRGTHPADRPRDSERAADESGQDLGF